MKGLFISSALLWDSFQLSTLSLSLHTDKGRRNNLYHRFHCSFLFYFDWIAISLSGLETFFFCLRVSDTATAQVTREETRFSEMGIIIKTQKVIGIHFNGFSSDVPVSYKKISLTVSPPTYPHATYSVSLTLTPVSSSRLLLIPH